MKRKLIIGFTIAMLAIILAVFSIDSKHYNNFVARKIEKAARLNGIQLAIVTLSLKTNSIRTEQVQLSTILSNGLPLMLSIDRLDFSPDWFGLIRAQSKNRVNLDMYQGKITAKTHSKFITNEHNLKFDLLNINLAEHPQIQGLGINQAVLNITNAEASIVKNNITSLTGKIRLFNLEKTGDTILSPDLTGLPLPLNIPPITDLSLTTLIKASTTSLMISDIQSDSSWGNFSGAIEFNNDSGRMKPVHANIKVKLTSAGSQLLGPFIPLLSSAKLSSETTQFSLKVSNSMLVAVP